jgi:hypothetical protein
MNSILSNENLKRLQDQKETIDLPNSRFMSLIKSNRIIETVSKELKLEPFDAMTILAIFAQIGGTAASCDGQRTYTYLNRQFKLIQIRKIFASCGAKNEFRKFARTNGKIIHKICETLEIEGNMYQKIIYLKSTTNPEPYKFWLSDFQAYTKDAPKEAKDLIVFAFPKRKKNK